MTSGLLFLAAMLLIAWPQKEAQDIDRAPTFDRLCGKLVRSEPLALKGRFNTTSVQQTALGKTELLLYKRQQDAICCENMHPIAKTVSADGGLFEFKKIAAGSYWVVVHLDGRDFKMPVRYQPAASSGTRCADSNFEVESSGSFELGRVTTFGK
jgi:hypothetical protein